jgi:hypothetical protein
MCDMLEHQVTQDGTVPATFADIIASYYADILIDMVQQYVNCNLGLISSGSA